MPATSGSTWGSSTWRTPRSARRGQQRRRRGRSEKTWSWPPPGPRSHGAAYSNNVTIFDRSLQRARSVVPERERGLEECGVRECLRVVPEVGVGVRIHLLGIQAERARELDELVEELSRRGPAPGGGERLHE